MRDFIWCVDAQAAQDTELKVNIVKFGDGYEQRSKSGINNALKSWSCSKTGRESELKEIRDFLIEHSGVTPFYMEFKEERDIYRTDGNISLKHQSADIWRLSFNVIQVPA